VIGGLITSTLLSMIVVPVVYTYLDDLRPAALLAWFRRPRRASATVPAAAPGVDVSEA
jgi:hypothetical protein